NDRYNLSIVEVLPATGASTFNISGTVSPAANGNGATMTLIQNGNPIASTVVSAGSYTFSGLSNGTYTVTPSKSGFNFTPGSANVTISGANQTANFTAALQTWTLSGAVTPGGLGT